MVLPQHTLFFRFVGKLSRALTFIFKLLTGDVNFAPRHRMLNGKHHNKINQLYNFHIPHLLTKQNLNPHLCFHLRKIILLLC
ncbi:hypothetical protein DS621_21125 [Salmonella enterica subsp. enterica serovar Teshie]|nr:hypothetical protein [Salmonella enterica subsp. enterica serovar Neukoelln]EAC0955067.1 hypothetical protein [Salmonella enterica subsp. enterica]EBR9811395.1 hypothetical protein [Salmonella enterica subsp. enterica serovar Teshie]EBZ5861095.1 hypothetical protein [Salmonella enterica subsp. enterica serovar Amersfoort]EBR9123804.1 hypothetical protein [Salmonella enterica subsp. enterica serovar Neukoelln]